MKDKTTDNDVQSDKTTTKTKDIKKTDNKNLIFI